MGYEPEKKVLQYESMDDGLKMAIHNTFRNHEKNIGDQTISLYKLIWQFVMEGDIDEFTKHRFSYSLEKVKEYYLSLSWNNVYDYIEHYLAFTPDYHNLIIDLNWMLEKHNSAYRIMGRKVVPITNEHELNEVSEACKTGQKAIDNHMKRAVEKFSNRETKDYSNTIKEAISAVEAAANIINVSEGKSLGDALNKLEKKGKIQENLKAAFQQLYSYTNDEHTGIRHGMASNPEYPPTFADAKFMLVACSAFINYLLQRNS